jgi:hypothetical protein
MVITQTLTARQPAPGAPIQVVAAVSATDFVNDNTPLFVVIGVTPTNVAPATLAGLTHHDGGATFQYTDVYWDAFQLTTRVASSGGVVTSDPYAQTQQVLQRVDANYQAGRFLWLLGFVAAPPVGGTVPDFVSGPYLIL